MRYFERLRKLIRLENGRCGQRAVFHTYLNGINRYLCYAHFEAPQKRIRSHEFIIHLTHGETMRCDYEITV